MQLRPSCLYSKHAIYLAVFSVQVLFSFLLIFKAIFTETNEKKISLPGLFPSMGTSLPLLLSEFHLLEVLGNSFANHCCFLEENQNKQQDLVVVALMGVAFLLSGAFVRMKCTHGRTESCDAWQC